MATDITRSSGHDRAQRNRAIRQEELREKLVAQGHEQHVVEIITKLKDEKLEIDSNMVQRYRIALDSHWKAIDKYLPSLKATEHSGEGGADIVISLAERIRKAYDSTTGE